MVLGLRSQQLKLASWDEITILQETISLQPAPNLKVNALEKDSDKLLILVHQVELSGIGVFEMT